MGTCDTHNIEQNIINDLELNNKIRDFIEMYRGEELWATTNGNVRPLTLISWCTSNPHLMDVLSEIVRNLNDRKGE